MTSTSLRGPGDRDRHADPRGWTGADGDQPDSRLSAGPRGPGLPVQAPRPVRRPCVTRSMRRSWRSPMPRSRAAPCISTRASWISRRARTSSVTRTARRHSSSSPTSVACRSTCPRRWRCFCPNVNSYRRLTRYLSAPINVHWGYDNRTAGLRVPMSDPEARRVENRVGGADANPYIAIAASLACGFLG